MAESTTRLKIRDWDGISLVEFSDRKILDEMCIAEIEDELFKLVETSGSGNLLLSFGNVGHFSSAALGMLLKLKKKVDDQSGTLKLSDINPQIYDVFKITKLNKKFDIYPSAQKAKASF
ncbi:MAG: STAS domain-containing protein [Phycisphaerae bacterium]